MLPMRKMVFRVVVVLPFGNLSMHFFESMIQSSGQQERRSELLFLLE